MKTWSFDSPDPETTRDVAIELGRSIGASGLVIGLIGPLGAGKTVFVKGLAAGLGVEPAQVSSPTFVIAQQYSLPFEATPAAQTSERPRVLHHVDLYRLESEAELEGIGFSDFFEPGSVVATEWADRFPDVLGAERLDIELEGPSAAEASRQGRRVRVSAHGAAAEAVLADWAERVERIRRLSLRRNGGAGGAGLGSGPQARAVWMLVLAIAMLGVSRVPEAGLSPPCANPAQRSADALGTRSVICDGPDTAMFSDGASEAADAPSARNAVNGIGGLLFGQPLDLQSVTAAQLEALPGIGPSRAEAIIAERARSAFQHVRDLERVPGIGPKTRERISAWLTLAPTQPERLERPERTGSSQPAAERPPEASRDG